MGLKLRDELLDREIVNTVLKAEVLIERCRRQDNSAVTHRSLGYRPPASETCLLLKAASAPLQRISTAEGRGT